MYKSNKKLGSKYFVTQSYQINLAAILAWVKMINPHLILLYVITERFSFIENSLHFVQISLHLPFGLSPVSKL